MNPDVVPGIITTYTKYNAYYSSFLVNPEVVPMIITTYTEYNDYYSSFLVNPEVVPGRMTMLVTLFLVLINIHNTIQTNSPKVIVNFVSDYERLNIMGILKMKYKIHISCIFVFIQILYFIICFLCLCFLCLFHTLFFTNYRVSESPL